jgi:predicted pyridoxine 5'-phosphate oxidase superfamily flavin-nucleotide-binding protein
VTIALAEIHRCFAGEVPSIICTSSSSGEPNLAHLSQVFLVDDDHVAVSNQFFGKTLSNIRENPFATLLCIDPDELVSYKLLVRHEATETSGERFEAAQRSIDAIASMTDMGHVFDLKAVDVYRVLDVSLVPSRGTQGSA